MFGKYPSMASKEETPATQQSILFELSDEILEKLATLYPPSSEKENPVAQLKRALIQKLPKTDLHVHGEAGLLMDVELARKLAKKNNIDFPEALIDQQNAWKYRGKEKFSQFLDDFSMLSSFIRTPKDLEDVAYAYYKHCYEHNVIFSLVGISWVQCKKYMTFLEFNAAYNRALARGMLAFGTVSVLRLRYYLERHIDAEPFEEIINHIKAFPNPFITTIGLAGGEENHPLSAFTSYFEAFKKNRVKPDHPFYFLTAHMEAFSDDKAIENSLTLLDWIAHGRNAANNSDTVIKMQSQGVSFELCPLSDVNVYPHIIPNLASHEQLKILMNAGLISLNSDDPGFFGDITEVYSQVFQQLKTSYSDLLYCTLKGIHPISPKIVNDMLRFKKDYYMNYMEIKKVSELKVKFFIAYWDLLPLIIDENIPKPLAQKILSIDLKYSEHALSACLQEITDEALYSKFNSLIKIKKNIITLTDQILEKTITMHNQFTSQYEELKEFSMDEDATVVYSFTTF